jgi:DNA-binding transcriptional ArsR family regulator
LTVQLEKAIGFKSKVRVLGAISEHGRIPVTKLSRVTGLNHEIINKSLETLRELNLVKEYRIGHNRLIESNFDRLSVTFEKKKGMTMSLK